MKIKLKIKNETLLCLLFFLPQINYYFSAVLSSYNIQTVTPLMYTVLIIMGGCSVLYNLRYKQCLIWSIGLALVILLSLGINENVIHFMIADFIFASPIIILCTIYFPIFLMFLTKININELLESAAIYSIITIALAIIAFVNYVFIQRTNIPDYMTFAYMLVSPIMFCIISAIQGKQFKAIWAILGYFIIFVGGCRGALLTVSIFLFLCFIKFFPSMKKSCIFIIKSIAFLISLIFISNINDIISTVSMFLDKFGYKSRVLAALTGTTYGGEMNTFFSGDGRNNIWQLGLDNIRFIGYGLFGDRTVVVNEYNNASYAHNWILEMLLSFGYILGTVAVLYVLWVVIKSIIVANQKNNRTNILLSYSVFCIIMVKHFISASFVSSIDFWFYLGLGCCIIKAVKGKNITGF